MCLLTEKLILRIEKLELSSKEMLKVVETDFKEYGKRINFKFQIPSESEVILSNDDRTIKKK